MYSLYRPWKQLLLLRNEPILDCAQETCCSWTHHHRRDTGTDPFEEAADKFRSILTW